MLSALFKAKRNARSNDGVWRMGASKRICAALRFKVALAAVAMQHLPSVQVPQVIDQFGTGAQRWRLAVALPKLFSNRCEFVLVESE